MWMQASAEVWKCTRLVGWLVGRRALGLRAIGPRGSKRTTP